MFGRVIDNSLLSPSLQEAKLIALVLNYNLPSQTHKLLQKGVTAAGCCQDSHVKTRFTKLTLCFAVAQTCICADGGANRLYNAAPGFAPHLSAVEARRRAKPAVIAGDLDSISNEVRQFYSDEGTIITDLSHDQDSTDFQKCLCELEKQFDAEQLATYTIVAAGEWHCS